MLIKSIFYSHGGDIKFGEHHVKCLIVVLKPLSLFPSPYHSLFLSLSAPPTHTHTLCCSFFLYVYIATSSLSNFTMTCVRILVLEFHVIGAIKWIKRQYKRKTIKFCRSWVAKSELAKFGQIAKFMGPTWVLSAPDGPHVGPMNLAIRVSVLGRSNLCWFTILTESILSLGMAILFWALFYWQIN